MESKPAPEDGKVEGQPTAHLNLKVGPVPLQPVYVGLQVQDAAGNSTQFKIKTQTALKKLMATYCERAGLDFQVSLWESL